MQRPSLLAALAAVSLALALAGCPAGDDGPSCPAGQTACGGVCFDLQADRLSCGRCLQACATGADCVAGECRCPAGQEVCGGACVDLQADASHCGACGRDCGLGTCASGACVCAPEATDCLGNPACVDLQTDLANCLACGERCLARGVCGAAGCACPAAFPEPCPAGTPTYCASFASTTDCGACGVACAEGGICDGSPAACRCPAGEQACGAAPGTCTAVATDEDNCGTCERRCATGATCTSSSCVCPAGTDVCGSTATSPGACVNRQTDEGNCGTCGNRCQTEATCEAGTCACPTSKPQACGDRCCAGDQCCGTGGGSCQPAHQNGLGQSYLSGCDAPYAPSQTTEAAALRAADAWAPGTTYAGTTGCNVLCLGRQTATSCAVWCYGFSGDIAGHVGLNTINNSCAAACPTPASPAWN